MKKEKTGSRALPEPMDLSAVLMPEELRDAVERIAENTHYVWLRGRLEEGWTWGPRRSDAAKESPCMVPYDELPENEKAYDRRTAESVIKMLLAMDYRIVPPPKP